MMEYFKNSIIPIYENIINYNVKLAKLAKENIETTNKMLKEHENLIESSNIIQQNINNFKNNSKHNLELIGEIYNINYIDKIRIEVEKLKERISEISLNNLNRLKGIKFDEGKDVITGYDQFCKEKNENNASETKANNEKTNNTIKKKNFKDKYYLSIHIICEGDLICEFNKDNKELMVKELSSILKRHKNEIFVVSNNKRNVINTFIKKNESEIKKNYEVLCDIKEYKEFNSLLNDLFYKECKIDINKYFDSNGNTIDFNTSCNLKRGTEDYDPPYGWMGFGLKVIDKFGDNNWLNDKNEKSEWAISYHGIGYFYDSDDIKNAIEDIIKNGLK